VIAINTTFRKAPWADVLYFADLRWWVAYGAEVERAVTGELWSIAERLQGAINWIQGVDEQGLSHTPGRIHTGKNSGYQAIGLAYLWGAAKIILLGYDMQKGPNGETHFHGDHRDPLPNLGDLPTWRQLLIQLGADLRTAGVEVINATRRTALTCFECLPIEQALFAPVQMPARAPASGTSALCVPPKLLPLEHDAFLRGLAAARFPAAGEVAPGADVSVIWGKGMLGYPMPTGRALVAENGYLRGRDGQQHCALALNGHNGAGDWPQGSRARLDALGVTLSPWRKDGGHVLVCPSRGIGAQPMPQDWTEKTVAALRKLTKREIRVRQHPGNWKKLPEHPDASLARDLEGAHACIIWASAAGVKALAMGIPVIYTAPHWICAGAAGSRLEDIEKPLMPDRLPVFERLASAQWSLDEIATGEPIRALLNLQPLTVLCVLKSGGDYNAEYVRKLRDGVAKNLTLPHRFVCLSDVEVPCERIPLKHNWKGWWSKLEMFRPDVIRGKTLYLDLDTVITGKLDAVMTIPHDFSMLNIRAKDVKVGNSGAMWFARAQPHVYQRFAEKPDYWIDYHVKHAENRYMGDQAFISDCFEHIPKLHQALPGFFQSFKYDRLQEKVPPECAVVCFGGPPRPHQAGGWVKQVWV